MPQINDPMPFCFTDYGKKHRNTFAVGKNSSSVWYVIRAVVKMHECMHTICISICILIQNRMNTLFIG